MQFRKISAIVILYICMLYTVNYIFAQGPQIRLAWEPSSDPNHSHYIIYRDTLPGTKVCLDTISGILVSYADKRVQLGKTYFYKLTAVNDAGQESMPTNEVFATIAALNSTKQSVISFIISKPVRVFISIFNWDGFKIWEHNQTYDIIGKHLVRWDGKDLHGKNVPPGKYYYQITTGQ